MLMFVTGCAKTGPAEVRAIDTSCDWVRPIMLASTEVDAMTAESLRQILAHNETWKEKCDGVNISQTN